MGDISKAKHASSKTYVRGKHAKHARVVESTRPPRLRYAAGTFLVSSAIALGLFAVLPFNASESVDVDETRTASAIQESLSTKSAKAIQKSVATSEQSSPAVQSQLVNESSNQESTTTESSETAFGSATAERDAAAESSYENDSTQIENNADNASLENQSQGEDSSIEGASDNAVTGDAEASSEQSNESADEPTASSDSNPVAEPDLRTESNASGTENSNNPSSLIASMVSSYDPDAVEANTAFFETVIEDKKHIAQDEAQKLAENPVHYTAIVEPQLQHGVLDSGCEIISLSMALESMGIKADPVDIAEGYLDFEGGMTDGFVGSPYEGGAGFPAGIEKAANAYLKDIGSDHHAYDLTGNSFDVIAGLVSRGYPVLIWTTIDFSEPFFHDVVEGDYQWYGNEHCVLLCGLSDDTVLVCDPLEGLIERDAEQFVDIYTQCGSMALYVR